MRVQRAARDVDIAEEVKVVARRERGGAALCCVKSCSDALSREMELVGQKWDRRVHAYASTLLTLGRLCNEMENSAGASLSD
mmetsp:Transcript_252/g.463  ORF Transcript_252/g.463 Transcript_252/m.463 type:complete len:82 (-) Transcript_252:427-672(-)